MSAWSARWSVSPPVSRVRLPLAAALLGMNYAWAIADPEGQFLQDRIARTRLVLRS